AANSVSILLGHGDGTFAAPVGYAGGSNAMAIAIGDFNADGKSDLVVANGTSNSANILLGKGDGTLEARITLATNSNSTSVAVGDFDSDGRMDLAVGNNGSKDV